MTAGLGQRNRLLAQWPHAAYGRMWHVDLLPAKTAQRLVVPPSDWSAIKTLGLEQGATIVWLEIALAEASSSLTGACIKRRVCSLAHVAALDPGRR